MALAPLAELGLLAICGILIAIGFAYYLLVHLPANWFANLLDGVSILGRKPLDFIARAIRSIDTTVMHWIGKAIENTSHAWKALWHYQAYAWHELADAISGAAEDTYRVFDHYKRFLIPALIDAALGPLAALAYTFRKQIKHAGEAAVSEALRIAHKSEQKVVATAAAVAGSIPFPRIRTLERDVTSLEKWVRKHSRLLTASGIAGLIATVLFKRMGLGWLRCKGVGRVGKSLCGLTGVIEALYAGTLATFAVTDLCRFAYGIERVAEEIRPLMLDFVDVENALFKCSSASYPHDFPLAPFSPTPVVSPIAF